MLTFWTKKKRRNLSQRTFETSSKLIGKIGIDMSSQLKMQRTLHYKSHPELLSRDNIKADSEALQLTLQQLFMQYFFCVSAISVEVAKSTVWVMMKSQLLLVSCSQCQRDQRVSVSSLEYTTVMKKIYSRDEAEGVSASPLEYIFYTTFVASGLRKFVS